MNSEIYLITFFYLMSQNTFEVNICKIGELMKVKHKKRLSKGS